MSHNTFKPFFSIISAIGLVIITLSVSVLTIFYIELEITRNTAIASNTILYYGGSLYGIGGDGKIIDIPEEDKYCNGLYTCTSSLYRIYKIKGVVYPSIIPRCPLDGNITCNDSEENAKKRLNEDKEFREVMKYWTYSWKSIVSYGIIFSTTMFLLLLFKYLNYTNSINNPTKLKIYDNISKWGILASITIPVISIGLKLVLLVAWLKYEEYTTNQRQQNTPQFLIDFEIKYSNVFYVVFSLETLITAIVLGKKILLLSKQIHRYRQNLEYSTLLG